MITTTTTARFLFLAAALAGCHDPAAPNPGAPARLSQAVSPRHGLDRTVRLTDSDLQFAKLALGGTTLQLSHLGSDSPIHVNGVHVSTPVYKLQLIMEAMTTDCEALPLDERADCVAEARAFLNQKLHVHPVRFDSYFKPSDFLIAEFAAIGVRRTPIQSFPAFTYELSAGQRAAIRTLNLGLKTVDRVRLLVNALKYTAAITDEIQFVDGGVRVSVPLTSRTPTVVCEGYANYALPGLDTWADEYCPDVHLSNMRLAITLHGLQPGAGTAITYGDADVQFTSEVDVSGTAGSLFEFLADEEAVVNGAVSQVIKTTLLEPSVRSAIGAALYTAVSQRTGHSGITITGVQAHPGELVVTYRLPGPADPRFPRLPTLPPPVSPAKP